MSKLISKEGKLFGKFNILDCLVLLILVIMIAGAIYKFGFVDNGIYVPDFKEGYITVLATGLNENEINAIKVGDSFFVPKIQHIGEITEISIEPRIDNQSSVDGKVYSVENPLFYDVTLKVKCTEMSFRKEHYYVGKNYKIICGQTLAGSTGLVTFNPTVREVVITEK